MKRDELIEQLKKLPADLDIRYLDIDLYMVDEIDWEFEMSIHSVEFRDKSKNVDSSTITSDGDTGTATAENGI